ncbi:hypothetical protein GCM10028789_27100 [Sinomonas halotolerans]
MSISEAAADLDSVVDAVVAEHEPVWLTRDGRRVAGLISIETYEQLLAAAEALERRQRDLGEGSASSGSEQ